MLFPFKILSIFFSTISAASFNNLPPITLADGSTLGAAILIIQNSLITSGSSNTQKGRLADIVAQRAWAWTAVSAWLKGISTPLKAWPRRLLCFCFFNCDLDLSVELADWAYLVMVAGAEDVVALPNFNVVAVDVTSGLTWIHSGTFPWPSMCVMKTDFSPLTDPVVVHTGCDLN